MNATNESEKLRIVSMFRHKCVFEELRVFRGKIMISSKSVDLTPTPRFLYYSLILGVNYHINSYWA